ncbi:hypothetical protein [Salinifilum ghardaiensis]
MLADIAERRYVARVEQRPVRDEHGHPTGRVQHGYRHHDGSFVPCRTWETALAAAWQANQEAA